MVSQNLTAHGTAVMNGIETINGPALANNTLIILTKAFGS